MSKTIGYTATLGFDAIWLLLHKLNFIDIERKIAVYVMAHDSNVEEVCRKMKNAGYEELANAFREGRIRDAAFCSAISFAESDVSTDAIEFGQVVYTIPFTLDLEYLSRISQYKFSAGEEGISA